MPIRSWPGGIGHRNHGVGHSGGQGNDILVNAAAIERVDIDLADDETLRKWPEDIDIAFHEWLQDSGNGIL